jgi:magnesium transporter
VSNKNDNKMPEEQRKIYPSNSAGRIVSSAVPAVRSRQTIKEVIDYLEKNVNKFESINYIYVLNRNSELSGVLSIKDMLRQDHSATVGKVMTRELIKVHPFTHQEKVAFLALRNNIKAVPVIDKNDMFIGAVLSDTILSVLHHEMQRDLSNISGVPNFPGKDIMSMSVKTAIKHRLPWLVF